MILAGLFFLALVPRVAYLLWSPPPFYGYYWELSSSLIAGGSLSLDGVPTTRFEPLYPLFLAGARLVTGDHALGVQLLQCGAASLGVVFFFLAARSIAGDRAALIASVLFAVHPLLIRHAPDLSDSALDTTLVLVFVWAFLRVRSAKTAALAGACLGLTVLTRSVVLPLLVVGPALLVAYRNRLGTAAAFAAATLAIIAPMIVRDYQVNHTLSPARQGENLFLGNSEYTSALMPDYSPDILLHYAHSTAASRLPSVSPNAPDFPDKVDAVLSGLAWAQMRNHPADTLALKLRDVWYFFSPFLVPSHLLLPDTTIELGPAGSVRLANAPIRPFAERATFTAFSSSILVLALAGIAIRGRAIAGDGILWGVLLVSAFVYAMYFPATRYNGPTAFVPLFYAAVAIERALA